MGAYRPALMKSGKWGKLVDSNLFTTNETDRTKFAGNGCDAHSIVGDPLFVNPLKGDYRVRDESPALKLGFKNFPMDKFGVQSPRLKAIARTPVLPAQKQTKTTNPGRPTDTWLGATIQELQGDEFSSFGVSKESGGVHLTKVPTGSLAAKAGFRDNDLIQGVNGKTVTGLREFFGIVNSAGGKPLSISFVRNQKKQAATVTLPTKE
jgi:membrane-associated protease RseP (regulator of RpoE activity)